MVESVLLSLSRCATISAGYLHEGQVELGRILRGGQLVMTASLIVADIVTSLLAFYLGDAIYGLVFPNSVGSLADRAGLVAVALMLPISYYLLEVYEVSGQAPIERFRLRIKSTCLLFVLFTSWQYAAGSGPWPFIAVLPTFLLVLTLPLIGETIVRNLLTSMGLWGVPVVVIGAGSTGQHVVRMLKKTPELGLRPIGIFDNEPEHDHRLPSRIEGVPLLGPIAECSTHSRGAETAIVTRPAASTTTVDQIAFDLDFRNIIIVPDLRELPTLLVKARDFNGLIGLQMQRNLLMRRNRWLKTAIDYLLAPPLLLIGLPIILGLAVWIRLVSEGSPFYNQVRAGKNGRQIKVWKLRTMYADAEARLEQHLRDDPKAKREWESCFKLSDDPRILPGVGHFLRRTSLDELPQVFNVVKGDMSLVGPRPFPQYHLDGFDDIFQSLRSSVIPGMTGLWQVSARSDGDLSVQEALDTYYIRNWSLWIDLYILFQTFGAVLAGRGAR